MTKKTGMAGGWEPAAPGGRAMPEDRNERDALEDPERFLAKFNDCIKQDIASRILHLSAVAADRAQIAESDEGDGYVRN